MNTLQLDQTINQLLKNNNNKFNVQVLPSDVTLRFLQQLLLTNNNGIHCVVANLDDSRNSGSHWICMLLDLNKNSAQLFDSLAIHDYYPFNIVKICKLLKKKFSKKFKTNKGMRFQSLSSNCCGHYCALFFHHRVLLGSTFESFCHLLHCKYPTELFS